MQRRPSLWRISVVFVVVLATLGVSVAVSVQAKGLTLAPAAVYGKVTKITSSMIYLKGSYLNRASMTWQIATNSKTKYYNKYLKLRSKSMVRIGDMVTAEGMLVNHTYRITGTTEVDDWSRK